MKPAVCLNTKHDILHACMSSIDAIMLPSVKRENILTFVDFENSIKIGIPLCDSNVNIVTTATIITYAPFGAHSQCLSIRRDDHPLQRSLWFALYRACHHAFCFLSIMLTHCHDSDNIRKMELKAARGLHRRFATASMCRPLSSLPFVYHQDGNTDQTPPLFHDRKIST